MEEVKTYHRNLAVALYDYKKAYEEQIRYLKKKKRRVSGYVIWRAHKKITSKRRELRKSKLRTDSLHLHLESKDLVSK